MTRSRTWIVRLGVLLVAVELVWLVAANLLLNSALLPALINRKPEKFGVHWESARSWYASRKK